MKILTSVKTILCSANIPRLGLLINLVLSCFVFVESAYSKEAQHEEQSNSVEIQPYDLHYIADIGGIRIESRHQLQKEDGQYKIKTKAKNFLGKVTEQASFEVSKNGTIIPIKYAKHQKTMMGKRSELQEFDWATNLLSYSVNKNQGKVTISPDQFDRLSLIQQLRLDVASSSKKFAYTVIRKGAFKQYQYQVIGNEILNTSKGTYNTVLVERQEKNSTKKTRMWFASDWDFAILKMETFEKNSKKTMVLDQGTLNGISILPLKNTTEI